MKVIAYRVGLTAIGALIVLMVDEAVEKLLSPGISINKGLIHRRQDYDSSHRQPGRLAAED